MESEHFENNNINIIYVKYRKQDEKIDYFDLIKEIEKYTDNDKYKDFNINIIYVDNILCDGNSLSDNIDSPLNENDIKTRNKNVNFLFLRNILPNSSK